MTVQNEQLRGALEAEQRAAYLRLRGGYPIPLAGATWWAILAIAGAAGWSPMRWSLFAFYTSGLLFPLAMLYARLFRVDFLRDRTAVSGALLPAFIAMLLFWPLAIGALWSHVALVPLILAIGMSIHWPVIGWTYGRTALYSAHAVVRAIGALVIWQSLPERRYTVLPLWVSVIYLVTVAAILLDTRRLAPSPGASRATER